MRKLALLMLVLALCSPALFAQKVGIYAGYSYAYLGDPISPALNTNGFEVQPMFMVGKHFAIVGDVSGQYATDMGQPVHLYTYMAGPAYVAHIGKSGLFNVHYLIGGANLGGFGESYNGFAMAPGFALDFKVAKHTYIRPVEFDWVYTHMEGTNLDKNFRYGAGVLFMF